MLSGFLSLTLLLAPYTFLWFSLTRSFHPISIGAFLGTAFLYMLVACTLASYAPITNTLTKYLTFFCKPWFYWGEDIEGGYLYSEAESYIYWVDLTESDPLFNRDVSLENLSISVGDVKLPITDFYYSLPFFGARRRICVDVAAIGVAYGLSKTFRNSFTDYLDSYALEVSELAFKKALEG